MAEEESSDYDLDKLLIQAKKYFKSNPDPLNKESLCSLLDAIGLLEAWNSDEEIAYLWELISKYAINDNVDYEAVRKGFQELLSSPDQRDSVSSIRASFKQPSFNTLNPVNRQSIGTTISKIDIDKIKQLKQIFSLLNLQNNGLISIAEIQTILKKYKFLRLSQEELLSFLMQICDKATEEFHKNSMLKINFELFSKAISAMEKQVLEGNSDFFTENINDSMEYGTDPLEVIDEMNQLESDTNEYLSVLSEIQISLMDIQRLINGNYQKILQQNYNENDNEETVLMTIKDESFMYETKLKDLEMFIKDLMKHSKKKVIMLDYFKQIVEEHNISMKGLEDDYRKLYAKYNTNQPVEIDEQITKLLQEIDVSNRLAEEKTVSIEKLQRELQEKETDYNTMTLKYKQIEATNKDNTKEIIRLKIDNDQLNKNYNFIVNEVLAKIEKENDTANLPSKNPSIDSSKKNKNDEAMIERMQKQINLTEDQKKLLTYNYENLFQYALHLDINNKQLLDKNKELEKKIRERTEEFEVNKKEMFNERQINIVLRAENDRYQNQLHELSKELEMNARLRTSTILGRISMNRLSKMENNTNALININKLGAPIGGMYNNPFETNDTLKTNAIKGNRMMTRSNERGDLKNIKATQGPMGNNATITDAMNTKSKDNQGLEINDQYYQQIGLNNKENSQYGPIGNIADKTNMTQRQKEDYTHIRLSNIKLGENSTNMNTFQRLDMMENDNDNDNINKNDRSAESFIQNLIPESTNVFVKTKYGDNMTNSIPECDEKDKGNPSSNSNIMGKESIRLEIDNHASQGLFQTRNSPEKDQNKKTFNPNAFAQGNENFDIERESVMVQHNEREDGGIEDCINQGMTIDDSPNNKHQQYSKESQNLFNFNPEFSQSNKQLVNSSLIDDRDASINNNLASQFVRNEKRSLTSTMLQTKSTLQNSQLNHQATHVRSTTVEDISKLFENTESKYKRYDFLNLRTKDEITTILEESHDNSPSYCMFSDNISFIELDQKSKKIIFITLDSIYILRPTNLTMKCKYVRNQLKKLNISTRNCNLISMEFHKGDDLIIETLRRMELLYFLRDIYKVKSNGKLGYKYTEDFNLKQKGNYAAYSTKSNIDSITANFANAQKIGYLEKMAPGIFSYYFHPKLVVLSNVGLMYFDEPNKPPKKLIPVIGSAIKAHEKLHNKDNCFEIIVNKERYVFATKTQEELNEWMDEFAKLKEDHMNQIKSHQNK